MDSRHRSGLLLLLALLVLNSSRMQAAPGYSFSAGSEISTSDNGRIDLSAYKKIFGYPDREITGTLIAAYSTSQYTQNPEELGTYLEGDILIPLNHNLSERNGIVTQSSRWPGAIVPYEIKGSFSARELGIIHHAFNEYHTRTCIRFRPRIKERDYIVVVNDKSGCWSGVGRIGGRQEVNLQSPTCLRTYGTAIHELMHALGFFHEHNRFERDYYIKVLMENVKSSAVVNFGKSSPKEAQAFGVPYDYASVMHYSPTSFSKNGQPTIKALKNTNEATKMGQRVGFSAGDILKLNAMYRCK